MQTILFIQMYFLVSDDREPIPPSSSVIIRYDVRFSASIYFYFLALYAILVYTDEDVIFCIYR